MINIQLDISQYLDKFNGYDSQQLFDLEFPELRNSLLKGICPTCNCKLKVSMKGDVYCNTARHKRITRERFFIRKESVDKIIKLKRLGL